jgi:hypothetical protein
MLKYLQDNCTTLSKYCSKPFTKRIKSVKDRDREIFQACQSIVSDEARKILVDMSKFIETQKIQKTISIVIGDHPLQNTSKNEWVVPISKDSPPGLSRNECLQIYEKFKGIFNTQFIDLSLPDKTETKEACIVLFTGDLTSLLGADLNKLYEEHVVLDFDKKKKMYGRVVNKITRYNLCYGPESQEPNYEEGKPRVVSYDQVPILKNVLDVLPTTFGDKFKNLNSESILYFDTEKCGLGFHGDSERKRVNVIRLGSPFTLHFQWYQSGKKIGEQISFILPGNCFYIMSEKATGQDWKKYGRLTIRHATGKV